MGNQIVCQDYYCQDVVLKPEWFSENSWNITYKYIDSENNLDNKKPYFINKGFLSLKNAKPSKIILSKKLHLDVHTFDKFIIPLSIKYHINNDIDVKIYLSNSLTIDIEKEHNDNINFFYYDLKILSHEIYLTRSYEKSLNIIKKKNKLKINEQQCSYFIEIKNDGDKLLIEENLSFKRGKNIIKQTTHNIDYDELYISVIIMNKNSIYDPNYFQICFD